MKKFLFIFLISCFSLTVISCGDEPFFEWDNSTTTTTSDDTTTTTDTTAPVIAEVTKVTTPTNDNTPNYTFSSTEAGTISYGGSCSSSTTIAISGNNTITLDSLSEGTYSDCIIAVRGFATNNLSNTLTITTFIVDTTAATLAEVTAVTTPTNDFTPNYTFSADEAGTITYGGSCSTGTTSATSGNNTITFTSLNDGTTYSNCTLIVTDSAGNASNTLAITSFTIDTSPGVFVGVGLGGNILRSTDNGTTWDNVTSPTSTTLNGVGFGNNTFVGVGSSGTIVRSTDNGSSFDNATSPTSTTLNGVTFGNNTFVGVGNSGNILRSTDNGSSWDNVTSPTSNHFNGITFGNNTFVGVGTSGSIVRSNDNGSSFDNVTFQTANHFQGVTFGNNAFVGVGYSGNIVRSTDNGTTWDNATSPTAKNLYGVTF